MLKEKIQILNQTEEDVLTLSQVRLILKDEYHQLKKDLKLLKRQKQITKDEYNSQILNLNLCYHNKRTEPLKKELTDSVTYLVNQYEEFNNLKASTDIKVQAQIQHEKESALKDEPNKKNEIKTLYSKSISTKKYLFWGLGIVLTTIIASFLLVFLWINPNLLKLTDSQTVTTFVIIVIGTVLTLTFLGYQLWVGRKKWVLDRDKDQKIVISSIPPIMAFDSLGLGCFATITSIFKKVGLFNDNKKIAGTLNAGTAIGMIAGCLLLGVVDVQIETVIAFVGSALIGSAIGSYLIRIIKVKKLSLVMGVVLSLAAILVLLTAKGIEVIPDGTKTGLANSNDWWKLVIGMICFIGLGLLLSFGIGIYAPAMVIIALLGMQFTTVLPIMTLAAGLAGQVSAYSSVKNNLYLPKTSWIMTIGTAIGEFLVILIVFGLINTLGGVSLTMIGNVLKYISVPVIGYSAFLLLKSYWKMRKNKDTAKVEKHLTKITSPIVDYENWFSKLPKQKLDYQLENKKRNYRKVKW